MDMSKVNTLIREAKRAAFDREWITASRLKRERFWTDASIQRFLPAPQHQSGYRVYSLLDVLSAEQSADYQRWFTHRLKKLHKHWSMKFGSEYADQLYDHTCTKLNIKG